MLNKTLKKISCSILALAIAGACVTDMPKFSSVNALSNKYEMEDAVLVGTGGSSVVLDSSTSGTGYVFLKNANDTITFDCEVAETGMYELIFGYSQNFDKNGKLQNLYVNGQNQGQVGFAYTEKDQFVEMSSGVIKLNKGTNTIKIESSWGWTLIDYAIIKNAALVELKGSNQLSNTKSTPETQSLMNYLSSIYGKNILSGQQELYGQAGEKEFEYIYNTTGKYPAIRGFDYMNYSQAVNWDDGTNSRIKKWVKERDGVATLCWHWFVPKDMSTYTDTTKLTYEMSSFYSDTTNFDASKAVIPGTAENKFIMKDISMIADDLLALQAEGIPVLWRPLHEAEGSSNTDGSGAWFWWGAAGAETYVKLWRLLYDTLTKEYGINNLIWVFNAYDYSTSSAWYPGDDYVDIVGYDKYNAKNWTTGTVAPNESALTSTFYNLVNYTNGSKMVAMTENDTIPSVEDLTVEKAGWLWFCPWYDYFITDSSYNNPTTLKSIYTSDYCLTLDELPANLYSFEAGETAVTTKPTTTVTTKPTTTTTTTSTSIPSGDFSFSKTKDVKAGVLELTVKVPEYDTADMFINPYYQDGVDWSWNAASLYAGLDGSKTITVTWDMSDIEAADETTVGKIGFQLGNCISEGEAFDVEVVKASIKIGSKEYSLVDLVGTHSVSARDDGYGNVASIEIMASSGKFKTAIVEAETTTTTTTSTTTATTTSLTTSTVTEVLYGDINSDGKIDNADLVSLSQHLIGEAVLEGKALTAADVALSGVVDIADLALLKQHIMGDKVKLG